MAPLRAGRELASHRCSGVLSSHHIRLRVLIHMSHHKVFEVGDSWHENDVNFKSKNRYT